MFKAFRKWWNYIGAKFNKDFNDRADPAVQLEQALTEAQDQHRRLRDQAVNVIATQKQSEIRLNTKMAELEKLNGNARQALVMAADATKSGDATKAAQYNSAAETIANQLIQTEKDVEGLKAMVINSTQAADQAKAAVAQNSRLLQQKLSEKNKLLSQLEQAKMQEQMNKAMDQLGETVGDDVPTLKEVSDKIEARYAKAQASSELQDTNVNSRIQEVSSAKSSVSTPRQRPPPRSQHRHRRPRFLSREPPAPADDNLLCSGLSGAAARDRRDARLRVQHAPADRACCVQRSLAPRRLLRRPYRGRTRLHPEYISRPSRLRENRR
jgi:phage shock protein A